MNLVINISLFFIVLFYTSLFANDIVWEKIGCPGNAPIHFDSENEQALFISKRKNSDSKIESTIRILDTKNGVYVFEDFREIKIYTARILNSGAHLGLVYVKDSSCAFDLVDIKTGGLIRSDILGNYIPKKYQITDSYIYTFDGLNRLQVWDIANGRERLYVDDDHEGTIGISEVKGRYAGIAWTKEFQLWDLETGEKMQSFGLFNPAHTKLCYLNGNLDTLYLVTLYHSPSGIDIDKFDVSNGKFIGSFRVTDSYYAKDLKLDGVKLVFAKKEISPYLYKEIVFVDMSTEQIVEIVDVELREFSLSETGDYLFLVNDDYTIFDIEKNEVVFELNCVEGAITIFYEESNSIILSKVSNSKMLELSTGDIKGEYNFYIRDHNLLSGRRFYIESYDSLVIIDLETGDTLDYHDLSGINHSDSKVSYNFEYCLLTRILDTTSILYSLKNKEIIDTIHFTDGFFTPDGKYLYGYYYTDNRTKAFFRIIETSSGELKFEDEVKQKQILSCPHVSNYIYLMTENEGLKRISLETFKTEDLSAELNRVGESHTVRFKATENAFIIERIDGQEVNIHDTKSGEIIKTYERYVDSYAFDVSDDVRYLIVSYYDGALILYELPEEMWINTSVETEMGATLSVYPNPAASAISVNAPDVIDGKLLLYDLFGAVHFIDKNFSSIKTIPVEGLAPGLYFIQINGDGKFFSEKILVVK